jgi:hypothetical protein
MRYSGLFVSSCLLVVGCSGSPVSLLRDGDPKVCASAEVTSQVTDIIKQHAPDPQGSQLVTGFPDLKGKLLVKVSASYANVNSVKVDTSNQVIVCSADVELSADGESRTGVVEYQVKLDQSNDELDVGARGYEVAAARIGELLGHLASASIKEASEQKEKLDTARAEKLEVVWRDQNPEAIARARQAVAEGNARSAFTAEEQSLMIRRQLLNDQCSEGGGDTRERICPVKTEVEKQLDDRGICYAAGFVRANNEAAFKCDY